MKPKVVIIAGPTASGKTLVALELARSFPVGIVSADSIQIYRYLDIGSAKATISERATVPHYMIDIKDPDEEFSAGEYVREARIVIQKILEKSMVPLVVGGTGLYIRLLRGGIADLPKTDFEIRSKLLEISQKNGVSVLYRKLEAIDPLAAKKIGPCNLVRILRALEVFELTGTPISEFHKKHALRDCPYEILYLGLTPQREKLYRAIDHRVDNMMSSGLLDEVRDLYDRGYNRKLKSLQSLGYRHAGMVIAGEANIFEATLLMKKDTRHYAKRQLTWFRSEPDVRWFDPMEISTIGVEVDNFLEH
ncbi:MAG: tRNA (adenosine(37)-N6)-dimethylallyltransferase MiaA [Desulfomonilaceae bacterium]